MVQISAGGAEKLGQHRGPVPTEGAKARLRRCHAICALRPDRPDARRNLSFGKFGGAGSPSSNDWEWTDPVTGTTFQMKYRIRFPSREGPPELHCAMDFFGEDPPEPFLDACDDRVAWLSDYCREHGLDLVINDETVLRRGREVEG
jgi:hypothetical protein